MKLKVIVLYSIQSPYKEDQLNSLSLITNYIIVWNTVYMQEAIELLRACGEIINEEDVIKLSPLLS